MKHFLSLGGLTGGVLGLTLLLFFLGTLDALEENLRDRLFVSQPAPEDVVIIAIDEKSLAAIGRWPWDREVHAKLLEILASAKPRAVGFDVNFAEPQDEKNDGALAGALARFPAPVVLPIEAHDLLLRDGAAEAKVFTLPLARLQKPNTIPGHVNVPVDDDGVARRVPLSIRSAEGRGLPAFALSLWRVLEPEKQLTLPPSRIQRISYLGPPGTFTTLSYSDTVVGSVPTHELADKVILVGATAPDLRDTLITSTSRGQAMAGVEIHANIFEMIRQNDFLFEVPPWLSLGLIILPTLVLGIILSWVRRLPAVIGISVFTLLIVIITGVIAFDRNFVLPIVYPPISLFGAFAAITAFRYTTEAKEKRWIRQTFQQYVSPQVVQELIRDPSKLTLGGELREVTVLFSDIRGFTTWSEKLKPAELVPLLNEYLSALTDVILRHEGVLDKYIGDAIMAFWGAPLPQPDHALRAIRTAEGMARRLEKLNAEWAERGIAPLKNGVGIATGEVIVGNMGSVKRFDYTVIGDTVNTASRLESATKELGEQIVFSETTAEQIKNTVPVRPLGEIMVKGKEKAVRVYTLSHLN